MDLHHHHHTTTNTNTTTNPNSNPNSNRAEAERLLGVAEKLLQNRDLTGSREFALLAQETEPLLEGSDQILAIADVLTASESRVNNNRYHDWYAILQTNPLSLSSDPDLLKKNYRRLALLLHPDKNRYPLADSAFKLVADAWALLSDPSRKGVYDHELSVYEKVQLTQQDKLPVRRSPRGGGSGGGEGRGEGGGSGPSPTPVAPHTGSGNNNNNNNPRASGAGKGRGREGGVTAGRMANFWTACPYCYMLYEYPRAYEDCCLRCQNCERAYHATVIDSLPPMVPGKEAYYACWGFFPLGFSLENNGNTNKGKKKAAGGDHNVENANHSNHNLNSGFPNWMPTGMFTPTPVASAATQGGGGVNMNVPNVNVNASVGGGIDISDGSASAGLGGGGGINNNASAGFGNVVLGMGTAASSKKRGRPRKNPLPG